VTAGAAAVACPRWRATASAVSPASSASVACVRRNAWGRQRRYLGGGGDALHMVVGMCRDLRRPAGQRRDASDTNSGASPARPSAIATR
jgi:hypothetical protein